MVQVRVLFTPHNEDLVTATEEIFRMERLVDVADKMDDELQRHRALVERDLFVRHSRSLSSVSLTVTLDNPEAIGTYHVHNSRNNTTLLTMAVPAIVHLARVGRVIL